jgi:hypothetical protein
VFELELRKTIKKIMSLGIGATMMGATILSASAAADLATYPAPFVQDGKFNAILVVGDKAASMDVIGSVDIATSLQYASRTKKSVTGSGGSSVSAEGDSWKVGTSSKDLELSEYLDTGVASAKQEAVNNITTSIGSDELGVLADGTFKNDKGDYKYRQFFYFDSPGAAGTAIAPRSVVYTEDPDTDVAATFFYVPDGKQVARYALEFTTSAESDLTDSTGDSSASTKTYLWNYEGQSLTMLGKEYSIVKARKTGTSGIELTLMGGAVKDILQEGETKTYTINGKDYEVSLVYTGSTSAKFTVNGESTDSLNEGSTDTLADATLIGVRDILYQDFAGGVHQAEFYLGAQKVVLTDDNIADVASSNSLKVGAEEIDGTEVMITGTNTSTGYKLDKISLNVTADQDIYVGAGEKLSAKMDEAEGMLDAWDVEYAGLSPVTMETIKIAGTSSQYDLDFVDGAGNSVTLPLMYTTGTTVVKMGDNNDELVLVEGTNIQKNDYFVVSDSTQDTGEEYSYVFRYLGASKSSASSPTISFKNVGSGETLDRTYDTKAGAIFASGSEDATIKMGGATFGVWNSSVDTASDFNITVDLNADGSQTAGAMAITTKSGAVISLAGQNASGVTDGNQALDLSKPENASTSGKLLVSINTPNADDYDDIAPTAVAFALSATAGEVDAAEQTALHFINPEGESNVYYTYGSMGGKIKFDQPSSSPASVVFDYPTQQALPQVFYTTPGTTISVGEAAEEGAITYYETTQIEVGAAKLASEVTNVAAQNVIIVGGPCANTVASEVMGNPADCTAGFEDGKAMVKLYQQTTGKVALLVAGWSAMDTRRASRVLANYATWQEAGKLKGTEVEIAGTSFTDITVSAPAPKVVETPVVEEEETPVAEE